MRTILVQVHSFIAYVFIVSAIISTIYAGIGFFGKSKYGETKFSLAKMTFVSSHIQLLIGMILWGSSEVFSQMKDNMSAVMSDSSLRLLAVEHPATNIIAIILITIGYIKTKKATDAHIKHKFNFIFYLIGIILILSRIPYHQWIE